MWNYFIEHIPWFTQYRQQFLKTLRFCPNEYLEHPIAFLCFAASNEPNPIEAFESMGEIESLPSLFQRGFYDTNSLYNSFILLHDNHLGDEVEAASSILRDFKRVYASHPCKLLCLNSIPLDQPLHHGETEQVFSPHINSFLKQQQQQISSSSVGKTERKMNNISNNDDVVLGCFLSQRDIENIKEFVGEFAVKGIFPELERKLRVLHSRVKAARSGFSNQFKYYFGRKKKGTTTVGRAVSSVSASNGGNIPSTPIYELNSVEAQIRQLADFAFLLQDYGLASEYYRLEYKND